MTVIHEFSRAWTNLMWDISWQAALLFVLIGIVALLAPRTSSAFRYGLWMIVLIRLCIPYSFTLPTGMSQHLQAPVEQAALTWVPAFNVALESNASLNAISMNPGIESQLSSARESHWNIPAATLLFLAWLGGALMLGAWVVFKAYRAHRALLNAPLLQDAHLVEWVDHLRQNLGIRQSVSLHQMDDEATCSSPMVYGLLHPAIYLPSSLLHPESKDKIEPILLHELAHIRRRDPLVNALQIAVQIVFFFHPLVWPLNRILRHLREEICDDIAVSHLRGEVSQYSRCMVNVLEQSQWQAAPRWGTMGLLENNGIQSRIRRLLDGKYRVYAGMKWWAVVGMVGIGILSFLFSAESPILSASNSTLAPDNSKLDLTYTCIDTNNNLLEGAVVRKVIFKLADVYKDTQDVQPIHLGPLLSDNKGQVTFTNIPYKKEEPIFSSLYGAIPGKMVGGCSIAFTLLFIPSKTIPVHVSVPEGFNPKEVTIRLYRFRIDADDPEKRIVFFAGLHEKLQEWPGMPEYHPDEKGNLLMPDLPTEGSFSILADAPGLCQIIFTSNNSSKTDFIHLDLSQEGIIEGTVSNIDGSPAVDKKVFSKLAYLKNSDQRGVIYPNTAKTDQNGNYRLHGLVDGEYNLFVPSEDNNPGIVSPVISGIKVRNGEVLRNVNIKLEKGALISGRVVAEETPIAVPDAHIIAHYPSLPEGFIVDYAKTDQNGYYELRLPIGKSRISLPFIFKRSFPEGVREVDIKPGETVKTVDFKVQ